MSVRLGVSILAALVLVSSTAARGGGFGPANVLTPGEQVDPPAGGLLLVGEQNRGLYFLEPKHLYEIDSGHIAGVSLWREWWMLCLFFWV
jgi:hypothetical protein